MKRGTAILVLHLAISLGRSQVPFATSPSWVSSDVSGYGTGAAWTDINRDGRPDLVIANGNDMARQRVTVYYATVTGTLPALPSWQSGDIDYHGHVAVGDINGDGLPDVAVSVYIGAAGFSQKGRVKLYLNRGGSLDVLPSWISADSVYTFSCALGDADGDGDQDLAVAAGEAYGQRAERSRIYFNSNGRLDSLPGWVAAQAGYAYDVGWTDIDLDGDLDLVFACERGPNRLYRNDGDSIGTTPVWQSGDVTQHANSLSIGDVNGDGLPDLAVSDNNQLGGNGRFKLYLNQGGTLGVLPAWTSSFSGYGSGILLADLDLNGAKDLLTGGWWQPCRIYINQGGTFSATPQWTSSTASVVEAIVLGDVDGDGLDTMDISFTGDGTRRLFLLPRSPLQELQAVRVGTDTLGPSQYCADLENGWISCATPPGVGEELVATTVVSDDPDMAVSNWDNSLGNYLFLNTTVTTSVGDELPVPAQIVLLRNYPNPFNPSTTVVFELPEAAAVRLSVADILGREVAVLAENTCTAGRHEVRWEPADLAGGMYFCVLATAGCRTTRPMIMMK